MTLTLAIKLLSDTTFGRGDGVAGLVDEEVEHDADTGLPFIRGRTLKGLLVEECANILYALPETPAQETFSQAAEWLFGVAGSSMSEGAHLRIGRADLPADLRQQVQLSISNLTYSKEQILDSLTTIRRQTAVSETGVPADRSLRASRVVLRDLTFYAALTIDAPAPATDDHLHLYLLAACVASVRRAGSGRNRGRGRVKMWITGDDYCFDTMLKEFVKKIGGEA